ncbi:MAG: deoxyguanosinetriphosphate triphosphohydrolase [Pseudomonadota bacterium]
MDQSHLAVYAAHPAESRGRLYPETGAAHRSPFQRDRDRIIHSSAFRRLKHKTQVFVEYEGDYYRTRLTHSIEVAQIARTVARTLRLNEDLAEAVALAHDLGHTPFGHTGEDVLSECMAEYGGFDHNAQALKIVTRLECHYAAFDGLNLTWETLEGIAKHNGPLLDRPDADTGHLPVVIADYNQQHDLELHTQASAEAQVAALSDDIAYVNHDLHDGLQAGLFSVEDILGLPIIGDCFAKVDRQWPGLEQTRRRHEALRRVFGVTVEDVLAESQRVLTELAPGSLADLQALDQPVVRFTEEMASDIAEIKAFLFARMYRHYRVKRIRQKVIRVVRELFEIFLNDPGVLPDHWRAEVEAATSETLRARVIADYIAGMTDRYALQEHKVLTDPLSRA